MGRLIDADVLEDKIIHALGISDEKYFLEAEKTIFKMIKHAPTVEERKKGKWIKGYDTVLEILDSAINAVSEVKAITLTYGTEQRWIPCSERLPEIGEEVFVYLFGDSAYVAWYNEDKRWRTSDFIVDDDEEPVAWMPLPEPWKGET